MRALTMSVSSKPTVGQPLIQILYSSFVVSWLHQILTHNTETKKKQTNKQTKKKKNKTKRKHPFNGSAFSDTKTTR